MPTRLAIALVVLFVAGCSGGGDSEALLLLKGTKTAAGGTVAVALFMQNPDQVEETRVEGGAVRIRVAWRDGKLEPYEFEVNAEEGTVVGLNEPATILIETEG